MCALLNQCVYILFVLLLMVMMKKQVDARLQTVSFSFDFLLFESRQNVLSQNSFIVLSILQKIVCQGARFSPQRAQFFVKIGKFRISYFHEFAIPCNKLSDKVYFLFALQKIGKDPF